MVKSSGLIDEFGVIGVRGTLFIRGVMAAKYWMASKYNGVTSHGSGQRPQFDHHARTYATTFQTTRVACKLCGVWVVD